MDAFLHTDFDMLVNSYWWKMMWDKSYSRTLVIATSMKNAFEYLDEDCELENITQFLDGATS